MVVGLPGLLVALLVRFGISEPPRGVSEGRVDRGEGLYDGTLCGHDFRAVAKTFQVRVWRDLRRAYDALAADDRRRLDGVVPAGHGLDRDSET